MTATIMFSSETTPEELQPRLADREIVDIAEARFMDPLQPEYEAFWRKLVSTASETLVDNEEVMVPMWTDHSYPEVFRDRAMLSVIGPTDFLRQFGATCLRTGLKGMVSYPTTVSMIGHYSPDFKARDFHRWVSEARAYQTEYPQAPAISEAYVFNWALELYLHHTLTEAELDDAIDSIEVENARPWVEDDWDGGYSLANKADQFPVLADLSATNVYSKDEQLQGWVNKKLHQWTNYMNDGETELPEWLKQASDSHGRRLYASLVRVSSNQDQDIDWQTVMPGVKRYGWDIVFDKAADGLRIAKKAKNASTRLEIVHQVLRLSKIKRQTSGKYAYFSGNDIAFMEEVLGESGDPMLPRMVAIERQATRRREAKEEADRLRREVQYHAETVAKPEYQARERAKGEVARLLETMRDIPVDS